MRPSEDGLQLQENSNIENRIFHLIYKILKNEQYLNTLSHLLNYGDPAGLLSI